MENHVVLLPMLKMEVNDYRSGIFLRDAEQC